MEASKDPQLKLCYIRVNTELILVSMIYMKLFVQTFIDPDALGDIQTFWNIVWCSRLLNISCLIHKIFFIPFTSRMEKVLITKIIRQIILLFYFYFWWLDKAAIFSGAQQYF